MSRGHAIAMSTDYAAGAAVAENCSADGGTPRRRIALLGHACSPIMGSEPGNTWSWAAHLSDSHDVTVFAHPVFRDAVEAELRARPKESLRFHWVTLSGFDPWDNARGERGVRLHYYLWQRKLLKVLRQTLTTTSFDLIHHVSWCSLLQTTRAWRCGVPTIWGPLGGGQKWPANFLSECPTFKARMFERFRSTMVNAVLINPSVRGAARNVAMAIASNLETERFLRKLGARRVELMGEGGVKAEWLRDTPRSATAGKLTLMTAGRLEARKGLPLLLQAVALVKDADIRLLIAGEGPMKESLRTEAAALGLANRVEFLGQVPWTQMPDVFARADVLAFPSLRDSMGSIALEALGAGLPIITLAHQGIGYLVTEATGIKVPVTTPADVIAGLAAAISKLALDTELRQRLSAEARRSADELTWSSRAAQMGLWYEQVLRASKKTPIGAATSRAWA